MITTTDLEEFAFINHFQQLETLSIDVASAKRAQTDLVEIKLAELKNLAIERDWAYYNPYFLFDCPKLQYLSARTFDGVKIVHPETVRHLQTDAMDSTMSQLKLFVNLESYKSREWVSTCYTGSLQKVDPRLEQPESDPLGYSTQIKRDDQGSV